MWTRQTAWVDRLCTMLQKQGRQQLWASCWPSVAFMLTQPQQKPALPPFTLQLRLGCLKNTSSFFLQSSSVRYCFWKLCNIGKGLQQNKPGQPNDGSCECVVYFQPFFPSCIVACIFLHLFWRVKDRLILLLLISLLAYDPPSQSTQTKKGRYDNIVCDALQGDMLTVCHTLWGDMVTGCHALQGDMVTQCATHSGEIW